MLSHKLPLWLAILLLGPLLYLALWAWIGLANRIVDNNIALHRIEAGLTP